MEVVVANQLANLPYFSKALWGAVAWSQSGHRSKSLQDLIRLSGRLFDASYVIGLLLLDGFVRGVIQAFARKSQERNLFYYLLEGGGRAPPEEEDFITCSGGRARPPPKKKSVAFSNPASQSRAEQVIKLPACESHLVIFASWRWQMELCHLANGALPAGKVRFARWQSGICRLAK